MTAPGGVIATVYVDVLPRIRDFSQQLRRQLNQASRELRSLDREIEPVNRAIQQIGVVATGIVPGVRLARASLLALGGHAVVGGMLSAAGAAYTLAGGIGAMPAVTVASASAMGTLAVGLRGVEDALKDFDDVEDFNAALEELSGNARATLGVLNEFRGEIDQFRDAVQDRLFAGLDDVARGLIETFLPRLTSHFGNLADVINLGARDLATFAQSAETLADVDEVAFNTETAFSLLRQSLVPAGVAFRDIVTVGSRFLPVIATEINTIVTRFSNWIQVMRATGELQERIARGIETFKQIGRIVENVGRTLNAVLGSAQTSGNGLLDTLERLTGKMADFFESSRGQTDVINFLESAREAAQALTPVVVALVDVFFNSLFPILESIAKAVGPAVAEFFAALGDALDQAAPGIEAFARGFAEFIRGIIPALPAVASLVSSLGQLVGVLAGRLGPIIAQIVTAIANILVPIFDALAAAFLFVNDGALKFIVVIAAVIAILAGLVTVVRGVIVTIRIFAGAMELLSGGMSRTQGAATGLVGFLSGPWGVAFGIALTALGLFLSTSDDSATAQTELKNAAADLNDVIREQNGVINENVRAKAAQQLEEQGAFALAQQLGISVEDVTNAYLNQGDALTQLRDQLNGNITALEAEQRKFEQTRGGRARAQQIQGEIDKNRELLDLINNLVGQRDADTAAQDRQNRAVQSGVGPFQAIQQAIAGVVLTGQQLLDFQRQYQVQQVEQLNSQIAYLNQLERTRQELAQGTQTLDIYTQEGRDNLAALTELFAAGVKRIQDLQAQNASTKDIAAATQDLENQLISLVQPFFANRDAARAFLEQMGLLPNSVTIQFYTNLPQILQQIRTIQSAIGSIAGNIFNIGGRARGGPVRPGEWSVVGEDGPELVRWGRAARVYSTDESERMATRVGSLDEMTTRGTAGATYGVAGGTWMGGSGTTTIQNRVDLQPTVRVYLGDRELTDVVRVEVDRRDRDLQRRIISNAGVRR